MMMSEILRCLLAVTLASSIAIVSVLTMRLTLRRLFGAAAAYSTWLLIPISVLATWVPHASRAGSTVALTLELDSTSALTHAFGRGLGSLVRTVPSFQWQLPVLAIWCVGVALFGGWLVLSQRTFVRALGRLSGSRRVLRAQRAAGCPALLGLVRPKIVLPPHFEARYTRFERMLIFAHERTHLRRGDATANAFGALLRCLFWFNPLVHLGWTYFRLDQELACDAAVIRDHPSARRTYANAMLKTELADAALPIGCHWQAASSFKERLSMLKKAIPSRTRRGWGRACVTLAAVAVGYAAWAAEPATKVTEQDSSDAGAIHILGQVSVTTVDDRHSLIGVASHAGGQIDHLFLYTSQTSTSVEMRAKDARARVDYEPDSGLRLTLPIPNQDEDPKHRFELLFGARGVVSSATRTQRDGSGADVVSHGLGVALGVSHYVIQPAISEDEFWKLQRTDDCGGEEPPCIRAATHSLPFPG